MIRKNEQIFESMPPQPHPIHFQNRNEKEEQIPLKFQPAPDQHYVKKPKKLSMTLSSSSHHSELNSQNCECCQGFESNCFNFCKPQPQRNQNEHQEQWSLCSCLNMNNSEEICGICWNLLCIECKDSLCLKFFICEECKQKLCSFCKGNLGITIQIKLRNYPIRLKGQNKYHFRNCLCRKCKENQNKEKKSQFSSQHQQKSVTIKQAIEREDQNP